jgi:hypothetical protein
MLNLNSETLIYFKARFTLGVRAEKTGQHAKYPHLPPHRALSSAISGPDGEALRRTV